MSTAADFAGFLSKSIGLGDDELPVLSPFLGTGNTIGAISFRMNLLEIKEIDQILEIQREEGKLFGQLAVHLGFLTPKQVERLVHLQQLHQYLEIGGRYVVAGHLSAARLIELLQQFHLEHIEPGDNS